MVVKVFKEPPVIKDFKVYKGNWDHKAYRACKVSRVLVYKEHKVFKVRLVFSPGLLPPQLTLTILPVLQLPVPVH